ncbi:hypothetical protein LHJ74_17245 [Streptomyces sp. N2-109]|uniref:Peptide chain release factor 1 n=1 Tax=Streptomyces gossypii TaxID=2883101 RepID=A0ABT2JUR2_9ACTN|nr:Vms1/Ankzf1 family peptidyl-tRNA hydrolase [Streptomyces gossypii]MCT2591622.1 hypothetical protein [Streptomyces gossypii]
MQLSLLRPMLDRPGPWASVYADTTHASEDAAKQRQLSARAAAEELAALGADNATCGAVHQALLEDVPTGGPGKRSGRAVLASDGAVVIDIPLAGPPAAPVTSWSPLPRISPLLKGIGEDPLCLVAYVNRLGADFELRGDGKQEAAGQIQGADWPLHRAPTADWSEKHFHTRVENTWERNAGEIAEAAADIWERSGADLLLLAGAPRERRAVRDRLPLPIRTVTVESEHGGRAPGSGSQLLERDIAEARAAHEAGHTAEVVERYWAGRGAERGAERESAPASAGVPALVEAAREHRIATLLVGPDGPDIGREVWIGPDPDQLATRRTELRYLGEAEPVAARADDALLRSAVAHKAEAVMVSDPAEAPEGGLGALLRWGTPGGQP